MIKNTESKSYIIIFSIILSIIVGLLLSIISINLKSYQDKNKKNEKYQNILKCINIHVSANNAQNKYNKYIKKNIIINNFGKILKIGKDFNIDIISEKRKNIKNQKMPIYIANNNNTIYYIIPLIGQGLWGEIFGYISFNKDLKVYGIVLDHKSETPGLGAEINQPFFLNLFKGEDIFDKNGNYMGIKIVKGNEDPKNINKQNNEIDGISGATKTCDGVSEMLINNIKFYLPFLKNIKSLYNNLYNQI